MHRAVAAIVARVSSLACTTQATLRATPLGRVQPGD